ncbi:MAG: TSUP family transporter [Proteobacteria bacterium]|nr:TSUP family transporter [Burkholderiales bacterium]
MSALATLSPMLLVWVVVVVAVAAYVYGVLGIGLPLIATPLLALVMPLQDAVIVLVVPVIVAIVMSTASVPDFWGTLKRFWFMPLAALVGAALGAQLFLRVPQFPYSLVLAAAIGSWLWLDWRGKSTSARIQRHPVSFGVLFGFVAGLFETTANVAAPPLIAYYAGLGLAPAAMIQGFNICFAPGKATQFVTLTMLGGVSVWQWVATIPLALVAVVAQHQGIRVRGSIEPATYRVWLRLALLAMALVIVVQYVGENAR